MDPSSPQPSTAAAHAGHSSPKAPWATSPDSRRRRRASQMAPGFEECSDMRLRRYLPQVTEPMTPWEPDAAEPISCRLTRPSCDPGGVFSGPRPEGTGVAGETIGSLCDGRPEGRHCCGDSLVTGGPVCTRPGGPLGPLEGDQGLIERVPQAVRTRSSNSLSAALKLG
jgi:hypothetical protein